jgi:hypothetical protein
VGVELRGVDSRVTPIRPSGGSYVCREVGDTRLRYGRRMRSLPRIDDGARRRLTARFGPEVGAWLDKLPAVLSALAERWQMEFDSLIPRGNMSIVLRCRMADGRPAVLKISPDPTRLANEAAALGRWPTVTPLRSLRSTRA